MSHAVSGEGAVLEVELDPQELRAITRSRPPEKPAAEGMPTDSRLLTRIVCGVGALVCFAAVASMLVSKRTTDDGKPAPVWMSGIAGALPAIAEAVLPSANPTPVVSEPETVKFANPFDQAEVFEFPAGTSLDEARDKVAALLLERAQERTPRRRR